MMQEESRSSTGSRHQTRTRSLLVIAQIALVLPLLVGAALLIRSFSALVQVDPGFRADNVVSLQLAIPRSKYPEDDDVAGFCGRLLAGITSLPGVVSAGMVNRLPLDGVGQINQFEFEGRESEMPAMVDSRTITPDYFRTMGIPLIEGRLFTDRDTPASAVASLPQLGAVSVAIVDERLARATWAGQTAIGKRVRLYGVIAYGVTQQIREFGIRMALGAARSDVTRLVLRRGATLAVGRTLIGLAAAGFLTRAMSSLLYGVKPNDPLCFVAAPVLLVGVALIASYLPARRAAWVDPAITLRGE
jgi:FtsX-like permease family protein/MacB-like protein